MADDRPNDSDDADPDRPAEPPADDPVSSALFGLAGNPGRTLALAAAAVLVVLYAVFLQQALFLVIWLAVAAFLIYLFWRFVRAHERLAGAAERLADGD